MTHAGGQEDGLCIFNSGAVRIPGLLKSRCISVGF